MPHRDHRFEYSMDAVAFIERTNCAKGCLEPRTIEDPNEPGGNCELIVTVAIGEPKAIPELHDGGHYIKCLRREATGKRKNPSLSTRAPTSSRQCNEPTTGPRSHAA